MSNNAQYASTPRFGSAVINTANTNRDGTGTLGFVLNAGPSGTRLDRIAVEAQGVTTAGMVRLFVTDGIPGPVITSISFSGTTATVTTATPHGLSTGAKVTLQGAFPREYNVQDTAVTVLTPTTFTYAMGTAPTMNASTVGNYATTPAGSAVIRLIGEVPVSAITPSGSVAAFSSVLNPINAPWLPLMLPAGYSLRASTHNAETFNVMAMGGDF
jgi:hypothetical protein